MGWSIPSGFTDLAFRPGPGTIEAYQASVQPAAGSRGGPSPELVAAVNAQAAARGVDPATLLAVIGYETAGTYNPNIWGGKGGDYFGLIQFGPNERSTYGVYEGMPVDKQVTAALNFLQDRGYDPSKHGLLDMYSTINAGSPGRYGASDRPGSTVRSHAAQIEQQYLSQARQYIGAPAAPSPRGQRGLFGLGQALARVPGMMVAPLAPRAGVALMSAGARAVGGMAPQGRPAAAPPSAPTTPGGMAYSTGPGGTSYQTSSGTWSWSNPATNQGGGEWVPPTTYSLTPGGGGGLSAAVASILGR